MTARTQKSTKVSDDERLEFAKQIKGEIIRNDPNISAQDAERKAFQAAGLPVGDDADLEDLPKGGRPRAAARKVGSGISSGASRAQVVVTSSGARKTIGGVLILGLVIGIIRDVTSGAAIRTDVVPRRIIGSFLSGILLMVLAGPAPRVARGLAFLVGFTIVALNQETIAKIAGATVDESTEVEIGGGGSKPLQPI